MERVFALGIDIGTTSLFGQVVDLKTGSAVQGYGHKQTAWVDAGPGAFALDAQAILEKVREIIEIAAEAYPLAAIGLTGQMHGICCLDAAGGLLSPLYTWQNQFGAVIGDTGKSYCGEITARTGCTVPTGYGLCTLYSLMRMGRLPDGCAKIATIMDFVGARLCGLTQPVTHPTNAASLGLYDIAANRFMYDKIAALGIDPALLPGVTDGIIGEYCGIPVCAAIGDNQAAVFGSLNGPDQVLVNVGTSGQVSVVTDTADAPGGELRPYLFGRCLCTGAALCGGRAYEALADLVTEIAAAFGGHPEKTDVYQYLNTQAAKDCPDPLQISTTFLGTRQAPQQRGSIENLSLSNFTPAHLARGVLTGIVSELYALYCQMGFTGTRVTPVVSGNAMRRNAVLRSITGKLFGKAPLVPAHTEEAAFGAALYAAVCAGAISQKDAARLIVYTQ